MHVGKYQSLVAALVPMLEGETKVFTVYELEKWDIRPDNSLAVFFYNATRRKDWKGLLTGRRYTWRREGRVILVQRLK